MTIDEAIQEFAKYARGENSFDELDLKEVVFDGVVAAELKYITQANHDEVSNTYDYDGIAEGVFKRIKELEKPV